jgi:hypothetical protein
VQIEISPSIGAVKYSWLFLISAAIPLPFSRSGSIRRRYAICAETAAAHTNSNAIETARVVRFSLRTGIEVASIAAIHSIIQQSETGFYLPVFYYQVKWWPVPWYQGFISLNIHLVKHISRKRHGADCSNKKQSPP